MKTFTFYPVTSLSPLTLDTENGIDVMCLQFPKMPTRRRIAWAELASGSYRPSDRGYEQDVFKSEFVVYGNQFETSLFQEWVRTWAFTALGVAVSDVVDNEFLFVPIITHATSIRVVVDYIGPSKQVAWAGVGDDIYHVDVTLRAVDPSNVTGVTEEFKLTLQDSFTSERTEGVTREYSYDGIPTIIKDGNDAGRFVGKSLCDLTDARKFLKFALRTQRGTAFNLSSVLSAALPGVTYPFGPTADYPYMARIFDFACERETIDRFLISFILVEDK